MTQQFNRSLNLKQLWILYYYVCEKPTLGTPLPSAPSQPQEVASRSVFSHPKPYDFTASLYLHWLSFPDVCALYILSCVLHLSFLETYRLTLRQTKKAVCGKHFKGTYITPLWGNRRQHCMHPSSKWRIQNALQLTQWKINLASQYANFATI